MNFQRWLKNPHFFCKILDIFKILKKIFAPSNGPLEYLQLLLKRFFSWVNYMMTMNFFQKLTFFWAKKLKNSYLLNGLT